MINQINQPYSNKREDSQKTINTKTVGLFIGIILTILASMVWSGLALVGIGLLSISFGFIVTSIINHRMNAESNWGTVIGGQFIGIGGIVVLLISYFL